MITKTPIDISFAEGLDTKTDPKRVQVGKFVELQNTIFDKGGLLQKRNGFGQLTSLPDTTYSYLTTFNENLTALGPTIAAYNTGGANWVAKGMIEPLSLETLPLLRNNFNQTLGDSVIATNGLICTVYLENHGGSTVNKYVIADSVTGQNIVAPSTIPVASGTVSGGMRVFILGNNFIIVFTNTITAVTHLQYIAINIYDQSLMVANTDIAAIYGADASLSWDGYVVNDRLFLAYNFGLATGVKVTYLNKNLTVLPAHTFAGANATTMSVTADNSDPTWPIVYLSYIDNMGGTSYTAAVDQNLNVLLAPHDLGLANGVNITSVAANGVCEVAIEIPNNYSFAPGTGTPTNFIKGITVTLASATSTAPVVLVRSVGLASKAFLMNGEAYFLAVYHSSYQPTYFLINGSESLASAPVIAAKLAYGNAGGYLTTGLPSVTVSGTAASVPYLFKDLIAAVNKNTAIPAGNQVAGIYSQTGINLCTFDFGTALLDTSEIGSNLHISGGFLGMYDGYLPVEHNFFLWPDLSPSASPDPVNSAAAAWSATGGSIVAKPDTANNTDAYYYQVTYEWSDNQGNAFRSAPSIPIAVTTTGAGTAGSITLKVPTLRLTMKTANPVKIVIYRWSLGQQEYYQVTSLTTPTLNDPTVDSVTFVDTLADATILGNNLLYTTGGVVEDVNAPASNLLTIFDTRLWLVDAEDQNLLWFSKQVIEATPVEMSDLFTVFVPPTTATQGSTGPITAISVLDDKLIIGKRNALLYLNGTGPDNTGANNQYSPPIFITSTVGCANQKSIVLMPQGLMFQSDKKGIWLLDRGLQTTYIGAPVEDFTLAATVLSAVNVPETNQVRFTLDSGVTLMYDYFYGQWGTFVGVPAVSSCIYQTKHTFIDEVGRAFQETPDQFLDGSNPVLIKFRTGPIRLGDLQNYQRAYFFYLLGTYLSPHKLQLSLTYDYDNAASQAVLVTPVNFSTPFGAGGSQSPFGQGTPFGGPGSLENWRIFLQRQRCMAFSITLQEIFDASQGQVAGGGLTLSGLNVVCGFKRGFRPQPASTSAG